MISFNIAIAILGHLSRNFVSGSDDDTDFKLEIVKITGSTSFLTFYFFFIPLALWGLI